MKIAYTMSDGPGYTDLLLFKLASSLQESGYRMAGTVQINTERCDTGPCDMDVKVLPDGPVVRISQDLGEGSKGCRLDPEALETAIGRVMVALESDIQCLIVNKFGKQEAEGRGFRPVIADALSRGIPVLVGLNKLNKEAFETFTGGIAEFLSPDHEIIEDWLLANMKQKSAMA